MFLVGISAFEFVQIIITYDLIKQRRCKPLNSPFEKKTCENEIRNTLQS